MALKIVVANQKGGVAKTTTCVNLGAGFAAKGFRTLLIDFDPQGNLTQYFAVLPKQNRTVGDWITSSEIPFDEVVVQTKFENLSFLPSDSTLTSFDTLMQKDGIKTNYFLSNKLEEVKERFDIILIDTSPSFSTLFVNALVAADKAIIPLKLEWLSVQGYSLIAGKIRDVQRFLGKPLSLLGALGTFYRKGVNESENSLKDIRSANINMFDTLIHQNTKVAEAAGHNVPIQYFDKSSQGFMDYEQLTAEVIEKCQLKQQLAATH